MVMSIVGVSSIGLATLAAYGLGFYLGVVYGLLHPIIPFLMLGIGVDDMFVIINVGFLVYISYITQFVHL
jgi:hypothetical protein